MSYEVVSLKKSKNGYVINFGTHAYMQKGEPLTASDKLEPMDELILALCRKIEELLSS